MQPGRVLSRKGRKVVGGSRPIVTTSEAVCYHPIRLDTEQMDRPLLCDSIRGAGVRHDREIPVQLMQSAR